MRTCDVSVWVKRVRRSVKRLVPYGLMRVWLSRRYDFELDEPAFRGEGVGKRLRQAIKCAMPYGLVMARAGKAMPEPGSAEPLPVDDSIPMQGEKAGGELTDGRLLYDISHWITVDFTTGIQRVVARMADEFRRRTDLESVAVAFHDGRLVECPYDEKTGRYTYGREWTARKGDVLLMLDSSWHLCDQFVPIFKAVRAVGGKVYSVVYDILPILHPECFDEVMPSVFSRWFRHAVKQSDGLLCISHSVACEVRRFVSANVDRDEIRKGLKIGHFHLGCDFVERAETSGASAGRSRTGAGKTFLSVGTIEPRKNHAYMLSVMEKVMASDAEVTWTIVGRPGWKTDAWLAELRLSPLFGTRIFLYADADDETLHRLYEESDILLNLSIGEGFGLPLVEAAAKGKRVVCSDIPVFREVDDGGFVFCPLTSAGRAASLILRLLNDEASESARPMMSRAAFTWADASRMLTDCIRGNWDWTDVGTVDIRLLFDGTILREGASFESARSGIFNVARELLRRFLANPRMAVTVVCEEPDRGAVDACLKAEEGLREVTAVSYDQLVRFRSPRCMSRLRDFFVRHPASARRRPFPKSVLVRVYAILRRLVLPMLERSCLASKSDLRRLTDSFDFLFSPVFAQPNWVRHAGLRFSAILYDLIPFKFPTLFPGAEASWLGTLVRTLRPEDVCFAVSNATKRDFLERLPTLHSDRIPVIPLAASSRFSVCSDLEKRRRIRQKYGIPVDKPYCLSLCSFAPHKNLPFTLTAFCRFARNHADWRLVLAGATFSNYSDEFQAALDALGDDRSRIVLTGYVDDDDQAALYSDAGFFVFLSLYEGFGLPPLEAMQCGCPVLTSNTSSLPEVVGDAGLMVDPTDVEAAARAMERLADDVELREELRKRGPERCRRFRWDAAATAVFEVLRKEKGSSR